MRARDRAWLLGILVLASACAAPLDPPPAGSETAAEPPRAGGVLRLASLDDVHTLDPARGYDVVSWSFEQMVFETLVAYDAGTRIVPQLARRWEASPDGRRYAFELRDDVRFSSGRPLDAEDVRYSIERLLRPTIHSQGAEFFTGIVGAAAFAAGQAPGVAGITTRGATHVEIALVESDPLLLDKLTMPFASVLDREAAERAGEDGVSQAPVGSGAFRLAEWTYGRRLRLERNPHYHEPGLPYLDGVDLAIGVSEQLGWFRYQAGELDLANVPSAEFRRVVADPRYRPLLLQRTTMRTQYLGLNCEVPPFDRPAVRRAVAQAVDRGRILELLDGRCVIASGVLPPDMPGRRRRPVAYDPARARARLAGLAPAALAAPVLWTWRDDNAMRIAQAIQQDLRAIGLAVQIKPVDFPALLEAVRHPGTVPLFLLGWEADFPDPSNFLTVLLHSAGRRANNHTFYASPHVDRLLDAAGAAIDPARRLRLFGMAETRILRDAPWVPLYHPVTVFVRHPRVRGYHLHPLRPARVDRVWLAE
ncbi:MAG: ABC transporter substrate-binding protein [Candidatus Binatia bacterium]